MIVPFAVISVISDALFTESNVWLTYYIDSLLVTSHCFGSCRADYCVVFSRRFAYNLIGSRFLPVM